MKKMNEAYFTALVSALCYIFPFALLVLLAFLFSGCSSGKTGMKFKGPEASILYGEWNRMCQELGHDPKKVGKGITITQSYSPESGRNNYGPYTCDAPNWCWHGVFDPVDWTIKYPRGVKHETKAHEVLHPIHEILKNGRGTELTPWHWEFTERRDGSLIRSSQLARARWPQTILPFVQSLLPGGPRPQDFWGAVDPDGIMCGRYR